MDDNTLRAAGFQEHEYPIARLFFSIFEINPETQDWRKRSQENGTNESEEISL